MITGIISLAVAIGFIVSLVLTQTRFVQYAGYADPIMMLLMGFYFLKVPADMLIQAFRELLMMAPKKEVMQKVQQEVTLINQDLDSNIQVAAVTKVGQELRVKLNVHTEDNTLDIAEIKHTKSRLNERLSPLTTDLNLVMNVAC
ncbi:hypothetical protein [Vibrio sp.]|uniref:hypothetical protein n=1 Tax=Vibrio sp. TaxID=678 RepID=UPI003790ED40